jgi:hypothetical protein
LRKEKPIKPNIYVNQINDQETNVDVINYNNRSNFQNTYAGNQQNSRGRNGYLPALGGYLGIQNTPSNSNRGAPPATQTRGTYRGNRGNLNQSRRGGKNDNQNNGNPNKNNCKNCRAPGHSVENCWKLQSKKAAMNPVHNENEFHVQPQEKEGLPVTSVYNTHSHKKQ